MPRARKDAGPATPPPVQPDPDSPGSEEVQVVLPAEDEPVRCGGHILTENGWVLEDAPVTEEAELEPADDPDPEQE